MTALVEGDQLLRTAGASASVAHARNGISACAKAIMALHVGISACLNLSPSSRAINYRVSLMRVA